MAFSRIAEAERKLISINQQREEMEERGWFRSPFRPERLDELGIPFELHVETESKYSVNAVSYSPVWVYGIWVNVGRPSVDIESRWDIVKLLLVAARDDLHEQEAVCSELAIDATTPREARDAASNYVGNSTARRNKRASP